MSNLILFLNSFFSYILLMAVIVLVAGAAVFIGIRLRKNENKKLEKQDSSREDA